MQHIYAVEKAFLIDFKRFERYIGQHTAAPVPLSSNWQALLLSASSLGVSEQLSAVNTFLHQSLTYMPDSMLYGVEDYWASPAELFARQKGDCEDWAIASYISLRALGIPDAQLRLVYVRAQVGPANSGLSQAHMVLAYYPDTEAEPLILDSLIQTILPASARTDLTPVFSFNSTGLWAGSGNQKSRQSATARLSRWRDLVQRLELQGVIL
ncbi:transglutaminase-like cysteine peptidase [Arsukibacterium sp.]|uniref:transglutaminase-like cysteine peptidase n=1 Tax=Arsukibacterium sp. TaxID=1977258 RepID=UPI0035699FAA